MPQLICLSEISSHQLSVTTSFHFNKKHRQISFRHKFQDSVILCIFFIKYYFIPKLCPCGTGSKHIVIIVELKRSKDCVVIKKLTPLYEMCG